MSIDINVPGFPDTGLIEQWANRLFKDIPANLPPSKGKEPVPNRYDPLLSKHKDEIQIPPLPSDASYHPAIPAPSSFSGMGFSPSAVHRVSAIDLRQQEQEPYSQAARQTQELRPSVAGSGISPSASNQGNDVDLKNPRTSLLDPHFVNTNKITSQPAGSGIPASGGFQQAEQLLYVPHNEPSYYFLHESNYVESIKAVKDAKVKSGNADGLARPHFDAYRIKNDFPILLKYVNGKPLIWLDNAATTQKPKQVIDRLSYFYENENSNIHRAAHEIAARATDAYEEAREKVKSFLNTASAREIVFVRGTTEAINLVAKSYGEQFLKPGDEVMLSHLEHHANIVPWQQLAQKNGVKIKVIPVDDDGQVILSEYTKLLSSKTKIVSFTQVSNALGTVTPAKQIIDLAHSAGAKVLLDGAQSVSHLRVDLQYLNPDFFVFSGHKIFGPTGIGVLYGKEDLLNAIQPWQGGGNMIKDVTFEHTQFHNAPTRFEAGTGNIADAVGLSAALDYVIKVGIDNINRYEHYLLEYATKLMKDIPGLRLIGTAPDKASVLSFTLEGFKNDEVGKALNEEGIAVRTGNHCAQPILRRFGLESTVRPSLAFYNTTGDVNTLVSVLHNLKGKK